MIYYYIFLFIFVYLLFFYINIDLYNNEKIILIVNKENFISNNNIPKIIHQTAPYDKTKWKKEWYSCQETWIKYFPQPEYKYIMWNDEDLENLILNDFSWYYNIYKSYKQNIQRIDIVRYFILYKYGGIYADMDYMCMKNFYDLLPSDKISISESPYKNNEHLQNALMISNKNNIFWLLVINEAIVRKNSRSILFSTGPQLISDIYSLNEEMVNVLPYNLYNPPKDSIEFSNKDIIAKHLGSCSWC